MESEPASRLEAYLSESGVAFTKHEHPTAYTAQEVAAAEHVPGRLVAKVVIVLADGRAVMLALPAPRRVDLQKARDVLGASDVRLAREEEFEGNFPDCEPGAIPPFGHLFGLPVYVDETLAEDETVFVQNCRHTETISLAYADFARLAQPVVAAFSQAP